MRMEFIWLGLIVLFAAVEACSVSLTSLWFIGGSLAGLICALFGGPVWLQAVLFFVVSVALLLCVRPLAKKYFTPRRIRTNAAGNIGRVALVTEAIDNLREQGAVRLSGVVWSARSTGGETIEEGAVVRIVSIEGVKLRVERVPAQAAATK